MRDGWLLCHDGGDIAFALDPRDGSVPWSSAGMGSGKERRGNVHFLALGGDRVFGLVDTGEAVLADVDRAGLTVRARFQACGRPAFAPPAIADGRLYVRDDTTVSCYDLTAAR